MSEFEVVITKQLNYVFHIEAESKEEAKNEAFQRMNNNTGYECIETKILTNQVIAKDITEHKEELKKDNSEDEDDTDF